MTIKVRPGLELRTRGDAGEVFDVIDANRAYLRRWFSWVDGATSPASVKKTMTSWQKANEAGTELTLGIFLEGRYVGNIGMYDIKKTNNSAVIGYWLAEADQGRGIMTDSVRAIVAHGFMTMGHNRISIHCAVDNVKSRAVATRLGFDFEGVAKDGECINGIYVDSAMYAIVKREWENRTNH